MDKPLKNVPDARATRRRLLACLLALPLGLLAAEGCMRMALFGESEAARTFGSSLRRAGNFAALDNHTGNDYWKLNELFSAPTERWKPKVPHPDLGWISSQIEPQTFGHKHAPMLQGRRPILLYGSSHARNSLGTKTRYRDLLDQSDLGSDFGLLNYAVSAHGMAQTLMVFERSIEQYQDQNPLVIYTIMIDRDLNRATHSVRQAPKPRFEMTPGNQLEISTPGTLDMAQDLVDNPLQITSYAWNFVLYATSLFSGSTGERLREIPAANALRTRIIEHVLSQVKQRCAELDVEVVIVILQADDTTDDPSRETWALEALTQACNQMGLPVVAAAPIVRSAAEASGLPVSSFYFQSGPSAHHPNDTGMRPIFKAFTRAIRRDFDNTTGAAR